MSVAPILKLFRPSSSAITLVSSDPCADTQFQRDPFSGGVKYTGVGGKNGTREKLATFDGNRSTIFLVSLFCAWNVTTVEINSGVHLLRS